jgi:hypothetical protein
VLLLLPPAAGALSPEAREFMAISKELEPVQCEKRKLRLGKLEPKLLHCPDPEDLAAISLQQREAFCRCD